MSPPLADVSLPHRKQLYVMRGPPGCGKSTAARALLAQYLQAHGLVGKLHEATPVCRAFILSTDDFFTTVDESSGSSVYSFDPQRIRQNHQRNKERCTIAMELGITPLFVDNTNSTLWEMRSYIELADKHGYSIHVIDPRSLNPRALDVNLLVTRCQEREQQTGKSIPRNVLQRMVSNFEEVDGAEELLEAVRAAHDPWEKNKGPPQPLYVGLDVEPQMLSAVGSLDLGPLFSSGDAAVADYIHARYCNRWELPRRLHVTVRFFGSRIRRDDEWMLQQAKDLCEAGKYDARVQELVFVRGGGLLVAAVTFENPNALESLAYAAGEEAWYPHVTLLYEKPWRAVDSNAVLEALAWARLEAEAESHTRQVEAAQIQALTQACQVAVSEAQVAMTCESSETEPERSMGNGVEGSELSSDGQGVPNSGNGFHSPLSLTDDKQLQKGNHAQVEMPVQIQEMKGDSPPGEVFDGNHHGAEESAKATNWSYASKPTLETFKEVQVLGRTVDLVVLRLKEQRLLRNCPFELFDVDGIMRS